MIFALQEICAAQAPALRIAGAERRRLSSPRRKKFRRNLVADYRGDEPAMAQGASVRVPLGEKRLSWRKPDEEKLP